MNLKFEWNNEKAALNIKKHNISFNEAQTVFKDRFALIFDDELHSDYENREIIIGHSTNNRLLIVCFTEKTEFHIRIFSSRQATKKERRDYEENKYSRIE